MPPKTAKMPKSPKRFERQFAEFTTFMIEQMAQRFRNQAILALNKGTVEKFADAQVGNYNTVFLTMANRVRRKLMVQFSNDRIEKQTKDMLEKVNRYNQQQTYAPIEQGLGINTTALIAQEGLKPQVNALMGETLQWAKKLRDDTLQHFTANTMRAMALGQPLEEVLAGFDLEASKRKNHAKFIARNQIANFNGLTTKIRHQKLGITQGIWITSKDERVRKCHQVRDGKEFDLTKGLYSSCDGKSLFPGTDYQCFPGDSQLNHTSFCEKLYRRRFTGKLTNIVFDDGVVLRATPNHPILTDKGFKAAHLINRGDNIIRAIDKSYDVLKLYGDNIIPTFEQIFSTLDFLGVEHGISASVGSEFHGDISDGEINVIELDSLLVDKINPAIREKFFELNLSGSDQEIILDSLTCLGNGFFGSHRLRDTATGIVGVLNLFRSRFLIHLSPLELFSFALGSWFDSKIKKSFSNNISGNSKVFSDCIFAFSVLVHGQDIIDRKIELIGLDIIDRNFKSNLAEFSGEGVSVDANILGNGRDSFPVRYELCSVQDNFFTDFTGHVYNLQNVSGYYTTETTTVSNCRCTYRAILPEAEE